MYHTNTPQPPFAGYTTSPTDHTSSYIQPFLTRTSLRSHDLGPRPAVEGCLSQFRVEEETCMSETAGDQAGEISLRECETDFEFEDSEED